MSVNGTKVSASVDGHQPELTPAEPSLQKTLEDLRAALSAASPLPVLEGCGLALRALESDRDRVVAEARAAGASWSTIGRATGMTRQSVHGRWGRKEVHGDGVEANASGRSLEGLSKSHGKGREPIKARREAVDVRLRRLPLRLGIEVIRRQLPTEGKGEEHL